MSLTNKQKINCYEAILKALHNEINLKGDNRPYYKYPLSKGITGFGICTLLDKYLCLQVYKIEPYLGNIKLKELFPELYKYKKKDIPFWLNDTKTRIKVVNKILKKLKINNHA